MDDRYFIKTLDKETADNLKAEGFTLLSQQNGLYIFVNDKTLSKKFGSNSGKLQFSNTLEF